MKIRQGGGAVADVEPKIKKPKSRSLKNALADSFGLSAPGSEINLLYEMGFLFYGLPAGVVFWFTIDNIKFYDLDITAAYAVTLGVYALSCVCVCLNVFFWDSRNPGLGLYLFKSKVEYFMVVDGFSIDNKESVDALCKHCRKYNIRFAAFMVCCLVIIFPAAQCVLVNLMLDASPRDVFKPGYIAVANFVSGVVMGYFANWFILFSKFAFVSDQEFRRRCENLKIDFDSRDEAV